MSGLNKVERFVQNRNRANIFTPQHPLASGPNSEQSLRRTLIAASARVQPPVTKLHTPPLSARPKETSIEDLSTGYERPKEFLKSGIETADRPSGQKDLFDTDVEDLTESLLSDNVLPRGSQEETANENVVQRGRSFQGQTSLQGTEDDVNQSNGKRPTKQHGMVHGLNETSEVLDRGEYRDDSSDASDDVRPGDDPTLTFTPEQAARVQDFSRRALKVVERPKAGLLPAKHNRDAKFSQPNDLYDVTGVQSQKTDRPSSSWLPADSSASLLHQPYGQVTANGKSKASNRAGTSPLHHREGVFESSEMGKDDESDLQPQSRQTILSSAVPSAEPSPSTPAPSSSITAELDYPPEILSSMTYADLLSQPFDTNPNPPPSVLPASHNDSALPSQLTYVLNLPATQQRQFFASITASQWEECGDWFVDQFATMMGKMKDARRQKRKVAMAFEDEVAAREKLVGGKIQGFENVLEGMKKGGQGLLGKGGL